MNDINKTQETKPLEKVVFSWSDNRLIGAAFIIALPLLLLLRFRIGIRILRVDLAAFLICVLSLIANLSDWLRNLPFIGSSRQMDMAAWKIFILIFTVLFIVRLIRSFQETKRRTPFTYSRSLGNSWLFPMFKNSPVAFFRKELNFQLILEPIICLVFSIIVGKNIAPNLGTFLMISSVALFIVMWQIRSNLFTLRYDRNDAMIISDVVIQDTSDPVNDTAQMATGNTSNTSGDSDDEVYI